MTDLIQIWPVVVTSFEGVPYFKVALNSYVLKNCVEITFFKIFTVC